MITELRKLPSMYPTTSDGNFSYYCRFMEKAGKGKGIEAIVNQNKVIQLLHMIGKIKVLLNSIDWGLKKFSLSHKTYRRNKMTQSLSKIEDMYSLQSAVVILKFYLRDLMTHISREGYTRLLLCL